MRSLVLVVLTVTACSFDQRGVGAGSGNDAPPGTADARVDATVDASQVGCSCKGATLSCVGMADQTCDLGCATTGSAAHCKAIVPSNGVPLSELNNVTAALETQSAGAINSKREYTIDTDSGEILDYGDDGYPTNSNPATIRGAGMGIVSGIGFDVIGPVGVLSVDSAHIAADSSLYGLGSRPLVILSRGDVLIEGDVDFSAGCFAGTVFVPTCAGPGGGSGATTTAAATGCGAGGNGAGQPGHYTGGGGGAMATRGGNGGDFSPGNKGGAGGSMQTCPGPTLVPIAGGAGGGNGGAGAGGEGGGGGGAIQITSMTKITVTHPVTASNASDIYVGGLGGAGTPVSDQGGGGGGAGGAILLEAPTVAINANGILAANGGGGGGGRITGPAADGQSGTSSGAQAQGGLGDGANGLTGHGGLGGAALGMASAGTGTQDGTGGGGGAVGRIRINTKTGTADTTGGVISPLPSQGAIVTQ